MTELDYLELIEEHQATITGLLQEINGHQVELLEHLGTIEAALMFLALLGFGVFVYKFIRLFF